jgi:hypothetical protein
MATLSTCGILPCYAAKIMIPKLTALALVLVSSVSTAAETVDTADTVAEAFYILLVEMQIRGLPDEKEMKALQPFLSEELIERIGYAWAEREKFVVEHSNEQLTFKSKPPWTKEGNLFGSLWEGMDSFKLGPSAGNEKVKSYPVYLSYGSDTTRWIDVLVLENTDRGWKVSNIFLNGPWAFRYHGSLRSILPSEAPAERKAANDNQK